MKRIHNAFLLGAVFSFALAACGGGGGSSPNIPSAAPLAHATAVFTITIPHPAQSGARAPKYISPNTASVTISLAAGALSLPANSPCTIAGGAITCATTGSSPGCTVGVGITACTLNVIAPVGNDQFNLDMFDAAGNKLSTGTVVAVVATAGATIALTMNGVVAHVSLALGTPVTVGTTTKVPVIVTATDASGATIVGPGSFTQPITLTNSDASGHTVLTPTSVPDPATGQTGVTLTYDGSPTVTTVTISAPGTSATPVVFTPVGLATPTPTPTTAPLACTGQVMAGTYTVFATTGSFASVGAGAYTIDLATSSYFQYTVVAATPSPTPSTTPLPTPSSTPSQTPTPTTTPTPNPLYVYFGTYNVAALAGGVATTGCAFIETTQNGSPLSVGSPDNALGLGLVVPAPGFTVSNVSMPGSFTAMNLNVSANGTGAGSFTLADGEMGTITITNRIAFAQFRKPQMFLRH